MHSIRRLFIVLIALTINISCETKKVSQQTTQTPSTPFKSTFSGTVLPVEIDTIYAKNAPNHITRNIMEDQKGHLWFATFGGLIQYDGKTFRDWTNETGPARFFSLLEDRKGHLWFGSIGAGLFRYDGNEFQKFTTKQGLIDDRITHLYEDTNGDIWLSTAGGISRYDGKSFQNFTRAQGLPDNEINAIIRDKTGQLWIGTRGHACTYDGKQFKILQSAQGRTFGNVRHFIEDSQGHIWFGGNDGLWCYDGKTFQSLTTDFTGYIYEDSKRNIWLSTHNSSYPDWTLSYYEKAALNTIGSPHKIVKKGESMVFGITEDTQQNIWAGNIDGIFRYNGTKLQYFRR